MTDARDSNPVDDLDLTERRLQNGHSATVSFYRPISEVLHVLVMDPDNPPVGMEIPNRPVSANDYVARLRGLLDTWGERLTLSFTAHYGEIFDGAVLEQFPQVRSLAIGGLDEAINLEAISELPHLTRLSLNYYGLEDNGLLGKLPVEQLTSLGLGKTKTKALDLAPLGRAGKLKGLYLEGHHRNLHALSALHGLEEFTFNPTAKGSLAFINGMSGLRVLKFVLGGTASIEEIALPVLEDLAFTMVRGLAELGDMQRFPALRRLRIQDQQQIRRIMFGADNTALEHLWLFNCSRLAAIDGLPECTQLKSLRWLFTGRDPSALSLPPSLTHLHMLSGKQKTEAAERAAIEKLGYIAEDHEGANFFYK